MAKKIKNCFIQNITYEKLYKAYLFARRGKRHRKDVIKFGLRYEERLLLMCNKLNSGNYTFGNFNEFYVYEPKLRRILAAPFKDRIVHTWYVKEFIEKIFVPQFISTSYACIKGRGMHKCALDVKRAMYKISKKNSKAYVVKMDVAKFFDSIDRRILFEIIKKKVSDKYFLDFTFKLLESSKKYDKKEGIGIPIGNYSSQMFGNIYLNEVDKYAKEVLKCKYYFRYLDDTCIICKNKEEAEYILSKLIIFYAEKLHLLLNKKTDIFPIKNGVNFCGYKISNKGYMNLRVKGKKKFIKKVKKVKYLLSNGEITVQEAKISLAGNIGYIKYARVDELVKKYLYSYFFKMIYIVYTYIILGKV